MAFNIQSLWQVLSILSLIVSLGCAIAVYMNSPGRKLETALKDLLAGFGTHKDEMSKGLKHHDRRIQAVENEIKHLPTSDEFGVLQLSVTRVEGDMKRVEGTLDRVDHVVQRIDDYLRTNK